MDIHHYDYLSFAYTHSSTAIESPREPGVYLVPANATTSPLLEHDQQHKVNVFNVTLGEWQLKDDWRGVELYKIDTGESFFITDVGVIPSDINACIDPPPSDLHSYVNGSWIIDNSKVALAIYKARSDKIAELKLACKTEITSGVTCDVLGGSYTYPSTKDDQDFLIARFSKAQALGTSGAPYKFMCCDALGVWERREHTAEQIIAVSLAVESHITAALNHLDAKLAALSAVADDVVLISQIVW